MGMTAAAAGTLRWRTPDESEGRNIGAAALIMRILLFSISSWLLRSCAWLARAADRTSAVAAGRRAPPQHSLLLASFLFASPLFLPSPPAGAQLSSAAAPSPAAATSAWRPSCTPRASCSLLFGNAFSSVPQSTSAISPPGAAAATCWNEALAVASATSPRNVARSSSERHHS